MNLPLRLQTALSFTEGAVLADIGTDHGYLPIAACLSGKARRAIACDINPGPLGKAQANIHAYGLTDRIETRLGSGLEPLVVGEADCAVIAGMGGMRIVEIIQKDEAKARSMKRLVLQPQHDIPRMRKMLHEYFFQISGEEFIYDGGRYYTLIAAAPSETSDNWSEVEYAYGKFILQKGGAVLDDFLRKEAAKLDEYRKTGDDASLIRRFELNREAYRIVT
jgi:tRNA (adenine22-N1)-methyltransferase